MSSDMLLIAASLAALVVVSAATFLCSRRRGWRRQSASQRSDALGHDVELGRGGGIDEAVLAAYPTMVFSSSTSSPPPPSPRQHGEEKKEKEKEKEKETEEDAQQGEKKKAAATAPTTPAGDTARLCAVCQADYADGDELRLLPDCQHAFHRRCVDRWLLRRPTCPVCRASPPARSG